MWFVFNKNLEACFETHTIPAGETIVFQAWGKHCEALIKMFKEAVKALTKDGGCDFLQEVWLEWLIKAAKLQGTKLPEKQACIFWITRCWLNMNSGGTNRLLPMMWQTFNLRNVSDLLMPAMWTFQTLQTTMMTLLWLCHCSHRHTTLLSCWPSIQHHLLNDRMAITWWDRGPSRTWAGRLGDCKQTMRKKQSEAKMLRRCERREKQIRFRKLQIG